MIEIFTAENLIALLTLSALEIVLGIDNIVFISILVAKLPKARQAVARQIGLWLAMLVRILLLLTISHIMHLTEPFFAVLGKGFSGRDIILLVGGLFLIGKATYEIHDKMEGGLTHINEVKKGATFASVIAQIVLIDIVFSLDSVITAVGMVKEIWVMVTAIVLAVLCMLIFAKSIGDFIEKHPTFKILALSFLLLIGVMLVADGLGQHIEKGYIYFALGFSLMVEAINIKIATKKRGLKTS